MIRRKLLLLTVALLSLSALPAPAEEIVEFWRSRYGDIQYARARPELDPSDGSLWLVEGAAVSRLSTSGRPTFRSEALHSPSSLSVDPANGSCWVLQANSDDLLHFAADGTLLSTTPGYPYDLSNSLSSSPSDGSAWVKTDEGVARVDATGTEVWRNSN